MRYGVRHRSPAPGWRSAAGPQSVRKRAAQQEVRGRRASEAASTAGQHVDPHRSPSLALPPEPSSPARLHPWKHCPPRNRSLVPKRLGTAGISYGGTCLGNLLFSPKRGSVPINSEAPDTRFGSGVRSPGFLSRLCNWSS